MNITVSVKIVLGRRLVPWSIIELAEDKTFASVFNEVKAGKYDFIAVCEELKRASVKQVLVGSTRENLMVVSEKQSVLTVCQDFGKFVEFRVELEQQREEAMQQCIPARNPFQIMAMAQRQLQFGDNGVPRKISVSTKKDQLFNDLVQLMKDIEVRWNDANAFGVPFLKNLTEILWYIDGHHHTIAERAPPIPTLFSDFNGYNCPERHKHRKRTRENLRAAELQSHSMTLCDFLESSWLKKDRFKQL